MGCGRRLRNATDSKDRSSAKCAESGMHRRDLGRVQRAVVWDECGGERWRKGDADEGARRLVEPVVLGASLGVVADVGIGILVGLLSVSASRHF